MPWIHFKISCFGPGGQGQAEKTVHFEPGNNIIEKINEYIKEEIHSEYYDGFRKLDVNWSTVKEMSREEIYEKRDSIKWKIAFLKRKLKELSKMPIKKERKQK
jgi:hypothetical protein